jgi:hypothetical protein
MSPATPAEPVAAAKPARARRAKTPAPTAAPDLKTVTLVIPGRDCADTIDACLSAVVPLLAGPHLARILFVDDGSKDDSAARASRYPVEVIRGKGQGPGAARNLGWRAASTPWVWFVDSDCVAQPDALDTLVQHLATCPTPDRVAAIGGSYGNMRPDSLLASLIQEEIVARHAKMSPEVTFLATFNVLYRREVLQQLQGFDATFLKGQDAELAYRVHAAGWQMRFTMASKVGHFHLDQLLPYLQVQRKQGYWRVWMLRAHPQQAGNDGYASRLDALPPVLAMAMLAGLPWITTPQGLALEAVLAAALVGCHVPLTMELLQRTGDPRMLAYAPMGAARAFGRGLGLTEGVLAIALKEARTRFVAAHRMDLAPPGRVAGSAG